MQADEQTHRHADRNTAHPFSGEVTASFRLLRYEPEKQTDDRCRKLQRRIPIPRLCEPGIRRLYHRATWMRRIPPTNVEQSTQRWTADRCRTILSASSPVEYKQKAHLSQRNRATHTVSWNIIWIEFIE